MLSSIIATSINCSRDCSEGFIYVIVCCIAIVWSARRSAQTNCSLDTSALLRPSACSLARGLLCHGMKRFVPCRSTSLFPVSQNLPYCHNLHLHVCNACTPGPVEMIFYNCFPLMLALEASTYRCLISGLLLRSTQFFVAGRLCEAIATHRQTCCGRSSSFCSASSPVGS